jgi:PhnB protein
MSANVKTIPDGYHSVTPYLAVHGAAKLIDFLQRAFDAAVTERMEGPDGAITHAEVRIGDSIVMLGEAPSERKPMPAMLYMYVADTDAVYRRAIAAGGTSIREPADQFYGDRSAAVQDACGNQWWLATRIENLTSEEIQKRAAAQH